MGDRVKRSSEEDRRMLKKAIATEYFLNRYELADEQRNHLKIAISHQIPIIISGTRAPAGKTTLCRFLREIGCDAKEIWELDNETNISGMLIMLNKPLKNICPDFYKSTWETAEFAVKMTLGFKDMDSAEIDAFADYVEEVIHDERYRRKSSYE